MEESQIYEHIKQVKKEKTEEDIQLITKSFKNHFVFSSLSENDV